MSAVARLLQTHRAGGERLRVLSASGQLGFGIVLYANAALQGAALGMQKSLSHLKAHGRLDEDPAVVVPFKERQRMVNKPFFDALEKKYIP